MQREQTTANQEQPQRVRFRNIDRKRGAGHPIESTKTELFLIDTEIQLIGREQFIANSEQGIEADILENGDLDYDPILLSGFDFVIASIHSHLDMTEEVATERLLKAIRNPYTSILGHPTGRLLLTRSGYPIDHRTIIEACAEYQVAIELNANPNRLDMDWKWIRYAVELGVQISINPDAHRSSAAA